MHDLDVAQRRARGRRGRAHRHGAADPPRLRAGGPLPRPRQERRPGRHLGDAHAPTSRCGTPTRSSPGEAEDVWPEVLADLEAGRSARHLPRAALARPARPARRSIPGRCRCSSPTPSAAAGSTACTSSGRSSSRAAARIPASTARCRPTISAPSARGRSDEFIAEVATHDGRSARAASSSWTTIRSRTPRTPRRCCAP